MPPTSDFRNKFHYSNYMYTLAGYVAEQISGQSWESLVNDTLLQKLHMRSTHFVDKHPNFDSVASPYAQQNGTFRALEKSLLL